MLIPRNFVAAILAMILAVSLANAKMTQLGLQPINSLSDLSSKLVFPLFFIVGFAIVGVQAASSFYSGLREDSETGHNKARHSTPDCSESK